MNKFLDEKEISTNYQIEIENTFDFQKIIEILKDPKKFEENDFFKSYKHSLFSPILSYIIDYLNENGPKKGYIGKGKIQKIQVLYIVLNRKIYDLFLSKKKGSLDDKKIEINFKSDEENENYYLQNVKKEKVLKLEDLKAIAFQMIEEKTEEENIDYDKLKILYDFKKRDVISSFRLGYSTQERIISMIIHNHENYLEEMPNVIFYYKNNKNKRYLEVDRILFSKEEINFPNIKVYYKAEYPINGPNSKKDFVKGEELKFEKNSINFIEVKSSINGLIKESDKDEETDQKVIIDKLNKTPSDLSSQSSKSSDNVEKKKKISKHFKHLEEFLELYRSFNTKYEKINLIYIIDSFFSKDFFNVVEKFSANYLPGKLLVPFDLQFVEIESDAIFIHESNIIQEMNDDFEKYKKSADKKYYEMETKANEQLINCQKIQNQFNAFQEESKEKYEKLKIDSEANYNQLNNLYKNLNEDSTEKSKQISEMKEQLSSLNSQMREINNKNNYKKMKKKIRKNIYKNNIMEKYINISDITSKKENNIIIGNYYHEKFNTIEKIHLCNIVYDNIIDLKTFVNIDSTLKEPNILSTVESKYRDNLETYIDSQFKRLTFFSDFLFFKKLLGVCIKEFKGKIITIFQDLDDVFSFVIKEKNSDNAFSEFKTNIPGVKDYVNLDKCKNIENFIDYYFELKSLDLSKDLVDFHIYNPYKDEDEFFITKYNNDLKDDRVGVLIYNHLSEDVKTHVNKLKQKYINILLILDKYNSEANIINSISNFFYKDKNFFISMVPDIIYKQLYASKDKKIFEIEDNRIVFDSTFNCIQYLYKIDKNKNIRLKEKKDIIDKNMIPLYDSLNKIYRNKKFSVLIEEPLSIISLYFVNLFKFNIFLIQSSYDKDLMTTILNNIQRKFNHTHGKNIFDYLKNGEKKFHLIIIENNIFPDDKNAFIPNQEYLKPENMNLFKNRLEDEGRIYFHVLLRNKYLFDSVKKKYEEYFVIKEIIQLFPLEFFFVCMKKSN